jgi:cell cycle arrest protein BUB2
MAASHPQGRPGFCLHRCHRCASKSSVGRWRTGWIGACGGGRLTFSNDFDISLNPIFVLAVQQRLEDDRQLPTLRGKVWRVLLGVGFIDVDAYLRYVALGPSDRHSNIVEDVQRTHATHARRSSRFKAVVSVESVIRVMNSFIHYRKAAQLHQEQSYYSQAWCIYAAVLLAQLPEPAAFWCFVSLLTHHSPAFANPEASVARDLSQHFEQLLSLFDPELSTYIFAKKAPGSLGFSAYSSTHSLFGHRKPMDQVAKIWDILLAFGAHMVVPLTVAELILKRSNILSGALDTRKLGTYNPDEEALLSGPIVSLAVALLPQVPQDLYLHLASAARAQQSSRSN